MKNHFFQFIVFILLPLLLITSCENQTSETVSIDAKKWEKVTLSFEGPSTSESANDNPFLNYRLSVTFTHANKSHTIPGFYAADGNAAESGAESGNIWKVHFRPDEEGEWNYTVSFRKGKDVAIADELEAGDPASFDGQTGIINVSAPDPAAEGRLQYVGERYLKYAESGRYFLKGGADSPENFLGYADFDGTIRGIPPEERSGEATATGGLHQYEPHLKDWKEGDPSWQGGKGKSMIGALNYLASKGMNSVYFLTMNIEGDGKDVWPYTGYEERFRFDCSKLDQWEMVFDHMDKLGLMLHVVLQETENEKLLDNGDTKYERKIYYRELIARFAHHLGVVWNMGEENGPADFSPDGQTTAQQKAMVKYLKEHDPYKNGIVIHTHSHNELRHEQFAKLLGDPNLDGMSIQVGNKADTHAETKYWVNQSAEAGKQWMVNLDEIGHHSRGVDPDDREDNNQDTVRAEVLWGNLMAGGGGAEWYFGYLNHNNDLGCEDWRSRDRMWDFTRYGLEFFQKHLPFHNMQSHDDLISNKDAYCFARPEEVFAIYLPFGGTTNLNLEEVNGEYTIAWYNPRKGGDVQAGSVTTLKGGENAGIGVAPTDPDKDWAVLIKKN